MCATAKKRCLWAWLGVVSRVPLILSCCMWSLYLANGQSKSKRAPGLAGVWGGGEDMKKMTYEQVVEQYFHNGLFLENLLLEMLAEETDVDRRIRLIEALIKLPGP